MILENSRVIRFLIVNNNSSDIIIFKEIISKEVYEYLINEAVNYADALNIIEKHKPNVVICDTEINNTQNNEITAIKLLRKIRQNEELNHIYFIFISSSTIQNEQLRYFDEGADDILIKPLNNAELKNKIKLAYKFSLVNIKLAESTKLMNELADTVENQSNGIIRFVLNLLDLRLPGISERLKWISEASVWIAKQLDDMDNDDLRNIELAALLSYIGKLSLPDYLIKSPVTKNGLATNELMYNIPIKSKEVLAGISGLSGISGIVNHIFENYDGSGFPDKLQSWQIPIASRIIRVAIDYCEEQSNSVHLPSIIIEKMKLEINRLYDRKAMILLEQYLAFTSSWDGSVNEKGVRLDELKSGMTLTRDIITYNGLKLMPAGCQLTEKIIEKIISHNTSDPILGHIFVQY